MWCTSGEGVVAFNKLFVDAGTPLDIVGFDGEDFLQRIRSTVSFEGPYLHLTEALTSVLSLAAKGLLGDKAVGADGTGVDFVCHKMVELHHIDIADNDFLGKGFASAAFDEERLPFMRQVSFFEVTADSFFSDAIEYRSGNFDTKFFAGPAEVCLKNLSDIHTARDTERVKDDLNGRPIRQVGHIFLFDHAGHYTFVAVASGHFVPYLDFALGGNVDFDLFDGVGVDVFAGFCLGYLAVGCYRNGPEEVGG